MSTYTGDMIKKHRTEQGLTQKKLGELCGIADSNIRKYESGRQNPKIETLQKIANALRVPVTDLIQDEDISLKIVKEDGSLETVATGWENIKATRKERELDIENYIKSAPIGRCKLLLNRFYRLNMHGQDKAIEQVELLTKIPEYQRKYIEENATILNAAHERTDIETTEEMKKHDDDIMNDENF